MNPRFYVKINPNFKFNKISLNNQTGFNSKSNPKKIFYNFNDYISYKVNSESNKNNNIKHKLFEKDFYSVVSENMLRVETILSKCDFLLFYLFIAVISNICQCLSCPNAVFLSFSISS